MQRAISHSGTAYSPHAIVRNPKTQALRLGVQVGCATSDTKALMACLRSLPATTINDNIPALYVSVYTLHLCVCVCSGGVLCREIIGSLMTNSSSTQRHENKTKQNPNYL